MSIPEVPLRFRVHPGIPRKPVPPGRDEWPGSAHIFHSMLDAGGSMALGCLLEQFRGRRVVESLAFPGCEPEPDLVHYAETHPAGVIPGAPRRLGMVPTEVLRRPDGVWDGVGYRVRDRGYRRGWATVGAGLHRHMLGLAPSWTRSRSPGAWSMVLPGLGRWVSSQFVPHIDAPRVVLTPVGASVLMRWGTTPSLPHLDEPFGGATEKRRGPPKRGPFVDVLQLAGALLGDDNITGLGDACVRLGMEPPVPCTDPIDRLRTETAAIARLYWQEVNLVLAMGLHGDPATLISTGGIAMTLWREAGVRP